MNDHRPISLAALAFTHPGGELETRLLWPGITPIAIDSVVIWRQVADH
jgi:hypothetical protein